MGDRNYTSDDVNCAGAIFYITRDYAVLEFWFYTNYTNIVKSPRWDRIDIVNVCVYICIN